jgi:dTDP-4-dehydrorhamnose reductase
MKYLILGANGLIGQHFVRLCKEKGIDYVGTRYSREGEELIPFNQLEFDRIPFFFDEVSPTVVVNSIGLAGGVNFCEENPEIGREYHVDATKTMVDWCRQNNVVFVYLSTDYVFDGKNPPYKEDDKTNPLNLYGELKLKGEQYIRANLERYVIARTTNVYGWDPETQTPNFLMYLYQTLEEGKPFKAPSFLRGNPTYVRDLAKAILELIDKKQYGLFHIVGSGYINRYDWAIKFCKIAGLDREKISEVKNPPENIVPRPFESNLNTEKVRKILGTKLHGIDEGLQLLIEEMKRNLFYQG